MSFDILTDDEFGHILNQTWPRVSDLSDDLKRTDNLSATLPLRESTPGGSADGSCLPSMTAQKHFSVPGPIYKQSVTDECLRYNIHDSPQFLAGKVFKKVPICYKVIWKFRGKHV